jgi:hypothetical protein
MDIGIPTRTAIFGTATMADLKYWLEALPRTNPGKYFDALSTACNDLAALDIELQDGLNLLDELRLHIYRHCTKLSHQYLNQSIDLPPHIAELADHASLLWQALGDAYMAQTTRDHAFIDHPQIHEPIKPSKAAITCLHRAIHCQQQVLLQNILLYKTDRQGHWGTLHKRYAMSLKFQINEHRINDSLYSEHPISCITDVYAAISLLRIANCNQLNQLEIMTLWQFIEKYAVLIEITTDPSGDYSVNLDSDNPPIRSKSISGKYTYTINYNDFVNRIDKNEQDESNKIVLNQRLKQHVLRALSGNIERVMPRHNSNKTVQIGIGLNNSWLAFSHHRNLDDMTRHLNEKPNVLMDDNNPMFAAKREQFLHDSWDGYHQQELSDKASFQSESVIAAIRQAQTSTLSREYREPELFDVIVKEHSAKGFCLKMTLPLSTVIKNGDVLVLREHHDDQYMLCVIRWVLNDDDYFIFGVEIIAPSAACFGARMLPNVGVIDNVLFSECLLLPEIPVLKLKARLLLPSATFASEGKVQLLRDDLEMIVKLNDVEQASFGYSIFNFTDLDDVMQRIPIIGLRIKSNDKSLNKLFI